MDGQTVAADGRKQQEVRLSGRSIAPGLGMGRAWVIGDVLYYDGIQPTIAPEDVNLFQFVDSPEEAFAKLQESLIRDHLEFPPPAKSLSPEIATTRR